MTLTVDAGHAEADQVRKQLERLVEVVEVEDLTGHEVHSRELVVAKVSASEVPSPLKRPPPLRVSASNISAWSLR